MKFNAQTAKAKTAEVVKNKMETRRARAEKAVDEIIVPLIEAEIAKGCYQVYIKKEALGEYSVADCYTVLEENGFEYTNYKGEFLVQW
jgi:hypothetical protein